MRSVIVLAFVLVFNVGCTQKKEKHITEVSQNELENVVLVDVRTPEEYNAGHLDKALNINWFDEDFEAQFKTIDKQETIYLYCKAGGRSQKATEKLKALGYSKVVNLVGGYDAWKAHMKSTD
jgi:phage shock protein E